MRMTLLSLMTNPTAYRKLKEETQKAVQSGLVSEPITFAEAKELPYLTVRIMLFRAPVPGSDLIEESVLTHISGGLAHRLWYWKACECVLPLSAAFPR